MVLSSAAPLAGRTTQRRSHIFAVETDNGGFAPTGFNLGSTQGNVHERAQRWRPLFEP